MDMDMEVEMEMDMDMDRDHENAEPCSIDLRTWYVGTSNKVPAETTLEASLIDKLSTTQHRRLFTW